MRGIVCLGLLAALSTGAAAAPATKTSTKAEEISRLGWEFEARQYKLPRSATTFRLKPGLAMVRGDGARRMVFLSQGHDFPEVEAVLVDPRTASGVIFAYLESGYVRLDDWARLNAQHLLQRIREVTDAANRRKSAAGLSTVTIKGWMHPPTLDRAKKSVSWAIEAVDGDTPIVNAVTLKLGKKGFERLTWVGRRDLYFAKKDLLDEIRNSLEFSAGARYGDFTRGDPQAEFGIATLVAAATGAGTAAAAGEWPGPLTWATLATVALLILLSSWVAVRWLHRRRAARVPEAR